MAGKKPVVFTYRLNGTLTIELWVEKRRKRLGDFTEETAWGYVVKDGTTALFKSKGINQDTIELVTDTYATSAYAAVILLNHLMPEGEDRLPLSFAQDPSKLTKRQLHWFLSDFRKYAQIQNYIDHLGQYSGAEFLMGDGTWVPLTEDGLPEAYPESTNE